MRTLRVYRVHTLVQNLGSLKGDEKPDGHRHFNVDDQKCGTTNKYICGCRCDECVAAMREANHRRAQARKGRKHELSANP